MKRREYLSFGNLFLILPFISCSNQSKATKQEKQILQKVKRTMLTMQRASWEQGLAAQAFLESSDDEMVYLLAKESVLRQTEDGRLSVLYHGTGVTDPAAVGEAVLYAAKKWDDQTLQKGADKMYRYLMEKAPRLKTGLLSHTIPDMEVWIDSIYMGPPFLAAYGNYKEAIKQINEIHKILWKPKNKLYSHRWNEDNKIFINEKFWGVGNGWAISGMCRVVNMLPQSMEKDRELLINQIRDNLTGLLIHMRKDYLFHDIVDDPNTFVETNLSQMITYTIFRGVKAGWLDESYIETALNMRQAVYNKVDEHGYVRDVCGAPFFNSPGVATEGQAFFILMEAAYNDYNGS